MSGDGSNLREQVIDLSQITSISPGTSPDLLDPAFSPDGQFIALTIQLSPVNQEIFLLNLQANRLRQLTTLGSSITDGAAWSSDGKFIAFSAASNVPGLSENQDIYVIDVDTGELTNLTNGVGQNREPAWSPTSSQLVFASDRETPNELEIWSLGAIGGTPERLTSAVRSSFSPAFSADGSKIAFISDRGGDNDLYVMNADGTDERLLSLDDNQADDLDPTWSLDDNWIALSSTRGGSPLLQLWLVNPVSEEWRQITNTQVAIRHADWRPVQ
jgi:TolB protein